MNTQAMIFLTKQRALHAEKIKQIEEKLASDLAKLPRWFGRREAEYRCYINAIHAKQRATDELCCALKRWTP